MLDSLDKYNLPPLEGQGLPKPLGVSLADNDHFNDHVSAAVNILRQALGRRKYAKHGLTKEALWKWCGTTNAIGSSYAQRSRAFEAAIEYLRAKDEILTWTVSVRIDNLWVGDSTVVTLRKRSRAPKKKARNARGTARRGAGRPARRQAA